VAPSRPAGAGTGGGGVNRALAMPVTPDTGASRIATGHSLSDVDSIGRESHSTGRLCHIHGASRLRVGDCCGHWGAGAA
jgi:hypothetical protein